MRILNITQTDWANYGFNNMMALRIAGADADGCKFRPHGFHYENEMDIVDEMEAIQKIRKADIIQIIHSDLHCFMLCKNIGKKIIIYHTGTGYRQNVLSYNEYFNSFVDFSITDQTEFMELGAKGIRYLTTAIGTERIFPQKEISGKIKIGHFPSKTKNDLKGTSKILNMLYECKKLFDKEDRFEVIACLEKIPHNKYLEKLQTCDIYVELFAPEQNGKPYGCYGVTAFEAAAMGKIVVTQNLYPDIYQKEFGGTELIYTNTKEIFMTIFEILMKQTEQELKTKQEMTRQWLVEKHSYPAIGKKLIGWLNENNT